MNSVIKEKIKKKILQGIWSIIPNNVITEILAESELHREQIPTWIVRILIKYKIIETNLKK